MGLPESSTISLSSYRNNISFRKNRDFKGNIVCFISDKNGYFEYTFIWKSTYYANMSKSYLKRYCSIDDNAQFKLNGILIGEMSLKSKAI